MYYLFYFYSFDWLCNTTFYLHRGSEWAQISLSAQTIVPLHMIYRHQIEIKDKYSNMNLHELL